MQCAAAVASLSRLHRTSVLVELFTALLRRQSYQHLIVYHDARFAGEVQAGCLDLLVDMGCIVVRTAQELMVQLDTRVYACSSPAHAAEEHGKGAPARHHRA